MLSNDQVLNKGRYRIVNTFRQDGNGGMYEAYDTVSNTTVVLKETVGTLGKIATSSQMEAINSAFLGGARVLTEIDHQSLVGVQDYFADIDRQYLVLEPVAGTDLTKFLGAGESRPEVSDVLLWTDQLLDALQYLHTRQEPIIHGDIRPENVKLTVESNVKLLTANAHVGGTSDVITVAPVQSSTDNAVNYRPLEQLWDGLDGSSQRVILNHYDEESERWLRRPLSPATDLYSLGATVYSALTGTVPPDALDRSIAALEGKPDPLAAPSTLNPAVPPEISDVILKSMSLRREDRFYSAVILRQILHTAAVRVKEREVKEVPLTVDAIKPEVPRADVRSIDPEPEQIHLSTEERRIEIEAEQQRIEQEQLQLEKRRFELEAEMESQRAEQQRLELEAEEARQRLELKAEETRQRLERERLAVEADRERERLKNEQKEREAEQARELAAKIIADKQSTSDEALLELDKIDNLVEPDRISSYLLEVPETSIVPDAECIEVTADDNDSDFVMPEEYRSGASKWRLPAIAAAFVLLAAVSIGVWKIMSSSAPVAASTSVAAPLVTAPQTEAQPVVSDDRTSSDPVPSTSGDTSTSALPSETVTHDKGKPVQLNAALDKQKKPAAAAPAKTPAPKKAVTVDDLINDH